MAAINAPDRTGLLAELDRRLALGEGFALATLNLDHLVQLRHNAAFRDAYDKQDFVTADGNPVVWLARLAGRRVDLLTGADLIKPIALLLAERGLALGFLGSTPEALATAARHLGAEVPGLDVRLRISPAMGLDPEGPEAMEALDRMVESGVRVILVALGAPRQERLAALARDRHPSLGLLSIGAGLDFWAGSQRRAPLWMRQFALEWLWRVANDPRRLASRYLRCAAILPGLAARTALVRAFGIAWPTSGPSATP